MYRIYRFLNSLFTFWIRSPTIGGASYPTVWFHMASLGEINAARGLMDRFMEHGYFVFATVFTHSGYEKLREIYKGVYNFEVVKFPYDKASFIEEVYRLKNIRALIIIETELWPNLIRISSNYTYLYLVNGRISDHNATRIKRFKFIFGDLLNRFKVIFPQSSYQHERFKEFGVPEERLVYIGNTKIDSLSIDSPMLIKRSEIGIPQKEFLVVFGSVRGKEVPYIVDAVKYLIKKGLGIIVAPRHLDRVGILEEKLKDVGIPYIKRTNGKYRPGHVFILDTLGELKKFYYLANLVFVGGTLEDYGGHNILEPAFFGKPVIFGPFIHNVKDEAEGLVMAGGGIKIKGKEELIDKIMELYIDSNKAALIGENALGYVEKIRRTSQKIFNYIMKELDESQRPLF